MVSTLIESRYRSGPPWAASIADTCPAGSTGASPPALLAIVAHDLREPLSVVRGYLSMLAADDLTEEGRARAITVMMAKVQEMAQAVDTLVTLSGRDAIELTPRVAVFDLRDAVREAISAVSARAALERARVEVAVPPEPVASRSDRDQVVRILVNLLVNALAYSPAPARIAVHLRPGDPVQVAVQDSGAGIPAHQHERVFGRFTRLQASEAPRSSGFGLGLPLSRELAEANGGTLGLESSAPGRGSVFVLRLPAAPSAPHDS